MDECAPPSGSVLESPFPASKVGRLMAAAASAAAGKPAAGEQHFLAASGRIKSFLTDHLERKRGGCVASPRIARPIDV